MASCYSEQVVGPTRRRTPIVRALFASSLIAACAGCDAPVTTVAVQNRYAPSATNALSIYQAFWHSTRFSDPVPPGASSEPHSSVPASATTAYVVLAPGWDPNSATVPTSFVVMQSRDGFALHLDEGLVVPVDDTTFVGHCAAGSFLTQEQADFITQHVFAEIFATMRYDAATCTTVPIAAPMTDAGGAE